MLFSLLTLNYFIDDIFYLEVANISNIKLLNEKMNFADCLKGTKRTLEKEPLERTSDIDEKELPVKIPRA